MNTNDDVFVGRPVQFPASLGVGKLPDADAIRRMQLFHQEAAARLDHFVELEKTRRGHQPLHRLVAQIDETCARRITAKYI